MSADCLIVLREAYRISELKEQLDNLSSLYGCGILYGPIDALITCEQVRLSSFDFAFEPTDAPDTASSNLILSHEGSCINGKSATYPLYLRLKTIQRFVEICIDYAAYIDIYISEDNPYLPDYSSYHLNCGEIADVLYKEYQLCKCPYPTIPNVWLHVSK